MIQTNYNPDVLSGFANLSNDEVFTPPYLVNDISDLLPAELWSNPNAKFLDPVCKILYAISKPFRHAKTSVRR